MTKHTYAVTIGADTYDIESDTPLTDAQAHQAASRQAEADMSPEQRLARLQEANKVPLPRQPKMSDEFTASKMGERGLAGLKGEAMALGAGIAAPAVLAYQLARHPVRTAEGAGKAVLGLAGAGYQAAMHPSETLDALSSAAYGLANSPEGIGNVAGGAMAAIAAPPLFKAAAGTRLGRAAITGISDATNAIPGVKAARAVFHPPVVTPVTPKVPLKVQTPSEMLGVSPTSTGAIMNSFPEAASPLPRPAGTRPFAMDLQSPETLAMIREEMAKRGGLPRLVKPGAGNLEQSLTSELRTPMNTSVDPAAVSTSAPGEVTMTRGGRPATTQAQYEAGIGQHGSRGTLREPPGSMPSAPSTLLPGGTQSRLLKYGFTKEEVDTFDIDTANAIIKQAEALIKGGAQRYTPVDLAKASTLEADMKTVRRGTSGAVTGANARQRKMPNGTIVQPIGTQLKAALAYEMARRSGG